MQHPGQAGTRRFEAECRRSGRPCWRRLAIARTGCARRRSRSGRAVAAGEQPAPAELPAKIYDAIHVGALFNIINRVTRTLGIEALPQELARRGAAFVYGARY